ncbi:hypothetical protein PHYPSEUDO_004644 [Phytophthora pseudosyringae]|uniref:Uncharacterized protein n=1 Tax=Phytophthora pseudosyringae TaxID=221518 RepID=A0A8T1VT60_9STRA|nr:hypothetical protein PHYPSEUDO_004644 [Phytophthora pseudosyringae]
MCYEVSALSHELNEKVGGERDCEAEFLDSNENDPQNLKLGQDDEDTESDEMPEEEEAKPKPRIAPTSTETNTDNEFEPEDDRGLTVGNVRHEPIGESRVVALNAAAETLCSLGCDEFNSATSSPGIDLVLDDIWPSRTVLRSGSIVLTNVLDNEPLLPGITMDGIEKQAERHTMETRQQFKKREAPKATMPQAAKRVMRDMNVRLRERAELVPRCAASQPVRFALNEAIALVERRQGTREDPSIRGFVLAVTEAARVLVEVLDFEQAKKNVNDMELIATVAVENLETELTSGEVRMMWTMVKGLQRLHDIFPESTKRVHRACLLFQKYLLKEYEVPAEVASDFKVQLTTTINELDRSLPQGMQPLADASKKISSIDQLLQGQYENWNPRTEPRFGGSLAAIQRFCSEQPGVTWDRLYVSICRACSKRSRSTFVWTADLTSEPPKRRASSFSELGFRNENRAKKDFSYVTSYEAYASYPLQVTKPSYKLKIFEELIDRLQWIFNAVGATEDQSLLPLHRLTQLNKCFSTLVKLCDNGDSLNLEGIPFMLLDLFPPGAHPEFVYPSVE